jgi:hypothetical protein
LRDAKYKQDEKVSNWLTRVADLALIRQRDLDALAQVADDMQVELHNLTTLYSEVQTAILASTGQTHPVSWAQPEGQTIREGLDAKAVTTVTGNNPVCGFGLTLRVGHQLVRRDAGHGLIVELLLDLTVHDDRLLYCRSTASLTARLPTVQPSMRGLAGLNAPLNPGGASSFIVPKGSYQGVLTIPVAGETVEKVKISISRSPGGGRRADTGACVYIPIT